MKVIRKSSVDCRPVEGFETQEIDKLLRSLWGIVIREEIYVDGPHVENPTVAHEFPKIVWKGIDETGKIVGIFNFKISNSLGHVFPKTNRTCHDASIVEFMRDTAAKYQHKNGEEIFAGVFTFVYDQPGDVRCGIYFSDVLDRSNPIHDSPSSVPANPLPFYRIPTRHVVSVGDDYGNATFVSSRPPAPIPPARITTPARTTEIEFAKPMRFIDSKILAEIKANNEALAAIIRRLEKDAS